MEAHRGKLFSEIAALIESSRIDVQMHANSTLTMLFWNIGKRINEDVLKNKRAEYGKEVVANLAAELSVKYGRNFELRNLRRMMQFAEEFPEKQIVSPLATQLTWSHFIELFSIKTHEKRLFYANLAAADKLTKLDLRRAIATKTFERTEIADTRIGANSPIPPNTFKDPYILDFLGLKDNYLEKDLEEAVLRELQSFILEMGKGFAFVERQKRMIIGGEDYYLDLLFYNRRLKRLVAVELKMGKFEAQFKGQMELYLKWLDRYEKAEGEDTPIGLILCAEANRELVELLEIHKDGIMVAEYLKDLPPKKELEQKLHSLLIETRERLQINDKTPSSNVL